MGTALITGASRGIGRAISNKLLVEGYRVIGLARNFADSENENENFDPIEVDLSDLTVLPEKLKSIFNRLPSLDALILCAGQGKFGSLEEFSYDQIRCLIDLNFTSQTFVVRAFIQKFKRAGNGHIIFMGSEAALQGSRKGSIYCASKFALRGFAQSLRDECGKSGVRVTIINPGMVKTEFFDGLNFEPGENQENYLIADDIAEIVSQILKARRESVVDEINVSPIKQEIRFKSC